MFYLTGNENVLKTVITLGKTVRTEINNEIELRNAYLEFLNSFLRDGVINLNADSQYCYDLNRIENLITSFTSDCDLTDIFTRTLSNTPLDSMFAALERVKAAKEYIGLHNEKLLSLFDLLIHTIFYTRSLESGGGSVSDAIGVIWCSNRKTWSLEDLAEFLVHEFSHNLVFIDEVRYKHYVDYALLAKEENYALSAILKIQRPLDKVFHSLIVAYEIINFRFDSGEPSSSLVHPSSTVLIENCRDTIKSIRQLLAKGKEDLVMPRFVELLNMVDYKLDKIKNLSELESVS